MVTTNEFLEFIEEEARELEPYGLKNSELKLSIFVKTKKESQTFILEIGKKDRSRRGYFAKTDASNKVILVEEELVNHLVKDFGYWRN